VTIQLAILGSSFLGDLWSYVSEYGSELARGLRRTIQVSAIAIAGAFFIGLVLGAARAHRVPVVSQLAAIYVEIIRNTPILVQIFFLYFGLGSLGVTELFGTGVTVDLRLDAFTVAWLSVMIWGGAFNTENFRAGFEAVPNRYREAGFALGFGRLATFLNVTLPIGGRIALPSSINTYISVLKNTSLLYVISYPELTTVALQINALTLQTVETFTVLAITYLALVWSMSAVIRFVEGRLALPEERS
jgi:polar amino acid transport system permease protein